MWLFVILIASFKDTDPYASISSGALGRVFALLILFGMSMSGLTYIISFFFSSPAGVQVAVIFLVFILGFILSIIGIVLRIISDTRDIYMDYLRYIFALFPPFALGDGMHNLASINIWSIRELKGGQTYAPTDWNITGMAIMMMGWESVVYLAIVIIYEYLSVITSLQR